MKALSIRQPWPWLIIHAPVEVRKDVENRDWKDKNSSLHVARRLATQGANNRGGEFLVHAGKGMTREEYEEAVSFALTMRPQIFLPVFGELQRGGIVGIARLTKVVRQHPSPWFFGPIGFLLADAAPLPFRQLKGQLGFFDAPDHWMPMRRDGVWQWSEAA